MEITPSNIMLGITLLSVAFSVFMFFRKPQEDIEKRQATDRVEVDSKAAILAQQLQWEKDSNERRFKELNESLTGSIVTSQNHISHIDAKIDSLTNMVNAMNVSITKEISVLSTRLDERFPGNK